VIDRSTAAKSRRRQGSASEQVLSNSDLRSPYLGHTARAKSSCRIAARVAAARCSGTMGDGQTYAERATEGTGMSPGEIRACNRLYAAHRRSKEICAFSEAFLAIKDVGASAELAALLCLRTDLEGLRHEIGYGDPNNSSRLAVVRHFGHLRKSLAAQFSSRGFRPAAHPHKQNRMPATSG
jgi:hypothetical protein